jgi:hypothetical protein
MPKSLQFVELHFFMLCIIQNEFLAASGRSDLCNDAKLHARQAHCLYIQLAELSALQLPESVNTCSPDPSATVLLG